MAIELSRAEREDFTRYTLWFAFACIIYSIIGFGWGALMGGIKDFRNFVDYSAYGRLIVRAHTHINLLGWVEMAIFAALYYVVPRLSGRPIHSVKLVKVHFWMHNFGLVGMVVFFSLAGMVGGMPDSGDPDAPAGLSAICSPWLACLAPWCCWPISFGDITCSVRQWVGKSART